MRGTPRLSSGQGCPAGVQARRARPGPRRPLSQAEVLAQVPEAPAFRDGCRRASPSQDRPKPHPRELLWELARAPLPLPAGAQG